MTVTYRHTIGAGGGAGGRANLKRKIAIRRKPNSRFKGAPEIARMRFKPKSWSRARGYVIKRTPIRRQGRPAIVSGRRAAPVRLLDRGEQLEEQQRAGVANRAGAVTKRPHQGLQVRARLGPYTHRLAGGESRLLHDRGTGLELETWLLNLLHLGDGAVMRFQRFRYQWIWQAGVVAKSGRNTVVLKLPAGE